MSLLCDCPLGTELTTIPNLDCGEKWDQIVRIAFQRRNAGGVLPVFDGTATNDIQVEADWNTRIAATDESKIVLTPFFSSLVFPNSESIVNGGGDNGTVFGLGEYNGEDNVSIDTPVFKNLTKEIKQAIDDLACYSLPQTGETQLWAYFLNRYNQIINIGNGALNEGVPVYNVRLSSTGSEGLNADNTNVLRFDLVNSPSKWDDNAQLTDATFNILGLTS